MESFRVIFFTSTCRTHLKIMYYVSAYSFLLVIFTIGTTSAFYCLEKSIERIFHPIDCTKYYQCENGGYRLLQCQPGYEFNKNSNKCQVMKFKGCVSKRLLNILNPECPSDKIDTSYPHDSDCTKFYSCVNGVLTLMICLPGTEFNPQNGQCEIITIFGCTANSQKNYVTDVAITTVNTEITIPNGFNSNYWLNPISTNTEFFTTEMLSDSTTTNEAITLSPDESLVVINSTTNSPNPVINVCSGNSTESIPHEKDCAKYYNCSNGTAQVLQCANGMEFNPITKICENISSNGCSSKVGVKI